MLFLGLLIGCCLGITIMAVISGGAYSRGFADGAKMNNKNKY